MIKLWVYSNMGESVAPTVKAHTKSEARAKLKKHYGLKRLPKGAILKGYNT